MTIFSDILELQAHIEAKLQELENTGIELSLKKQIPYGTQLYASDGISSGLINLYFSKKKGFSYVDCTKNEVTRRSISIFSGIEQEPPESNKNYEAEAKWKIWIGTDESGKGDFFGPLIVAGFLADKSIESTLISLGVKDSKELSSNQIQQKASSLFAKYGQRIHSVEILNPKYNELYNKMLNLNKILAWAHARVIQDLLEKARNLSMHVDGIISDQFGDEDFIKNALKSMQEINLIQRPKGESNLAVAAASIIARFRFETRMRELSAKYNLKIPMGASQEVIDCANILVAKYGKSILNNIAKVHFKTFRMLD